MTFRMNWERMGNHAPAARLPGTRLGKFREHSFQQRKGNAMFDVPTRVTRPIDKPKYNGWWTRQRKIVVLVIAAALILIVSLVAHASSGNADYANGYNDGYSAEQTEDVGIGFCQSAELTNVASGTPYNGNPDNDNSGSYNSGWATGCEDAANGSASNP
jgi:hypothetical protein